jgi:hypothetical protein
MALQVFQRVKPQGSRSATLNLLVQAVFIHQTMSAVTATKKAPTEKRVGELEKEKHVIMNARRKDSVLQQREWANWQMR